MPRDVFISHSAQDKKVAETICGALEEKGIRCWVAPRDVRPGKSFPGEITRAIQQSKVMLLIFSRHSNSSEQVLREVQLAVDCRVPIVRLRLEDIPLSDDLRYYLSTPHWLDALTHPLSKHIPPLIVAVKELLAGSDDSAGSASASSPVQPAAPASASSTEQRSSGTRKTPMIVWAIVVLAVLGFTMWSRLAKKSEPKSTLPPSTQPTPEVAPSPAVSASPVIAVTSPSPVVVPTPTPSPTAVEVTPTPPAKLSPSPSEPNRKGPLARNNRAWQTWIDEFVHNFIASNETNDVDLAMSFYAPTVDLFEEGRKSSDAIRRDIESYNVRWPSRRATIRGDVRLAEKAANHSYTASFEHDYYVENAGRGEWINGAVAVDLQITVEVEGVPRIVSMKQKTLRRDKGTMQKR
jgi:hypothetical protein